MKIPFWQGFVIQGNTPAVFLNQTDLVRFKNLNLTDLVRYKKFSSRDGKKKNTFWPNIAPNFGDREPCQEKRVKGYIISVAKH